MIVYGVDTSKKITPIMVRDAIIVCFKKAHDEVLDTMDEYTNWESKREREKFRNMNIELIVKSAFERAGEDFNHPSKEGLVLVIKNLADYAANFRKPAIIKKHYEEIMRLIRKIDDKKK